MLPSKYATQMCVPSNAIELGFSPTSTVATTVSNTVNRNKGTLSILLTLFSAHPKIGLTYCNLLISSCWLCTTLVNTDIMFMTLSEVLSVFTKSGTSSAINPIYILSLSVMYLNFLVFRSFIVLSASSTERLAMESESINSFEDTLMQTLPPLSTVNLFSLSPTTNNLSTSNSLDLYSAGTVVISSQSTGSQPPSCKLSYIEYSTFPLLFTKTSRY